MKKMYSTKMINTGGRSGEVHSPYHSFELNIAAPGRRVENATKPEQLFAAGFSACFNSALELIKNQKNIVGASTISAQVSLYAENEMSFVLGVEIEGHVDGLSLEETQELLEAAHKVCPYSKATAGNIEVTLTAVEG